MKKILFICTGNTCRSIMAEILFRHLVNKQQGQMEMTILSAGLAAFPGDGASHHARQALKEEGLDAEGHQARLLTPPLVEDADLVLAMTMRHKETVTALMPEMESKVYTLKEYCLPQGEIDSLDIDDPYGRSLQTYRKVREEIKGLLPRLLQKILGEV